MSGQTCVWQHVTDTSDSGLDESEDFLCLSLEKSGGSRSRSGVASPQCGERPTSLLMFACALLPVWPSCPSFGQEEGRDKSKSTYS